VTARGDVGAVWGDRLAEVWASPATAGTGLVVGARGVLTARHVIAGAAEGGAILARVVRPHEQTGVWVPMTVAWQDPQWDLAVLEVDPEGAPGDWLTPQSSNPVAVVLDTAVEDGCESVGFPDAVVQPAKNGKPSEAVRQSDQVQGKVLPAGQGKAPQADRPLPLSWVPFDADTQTPKVAAGWGGMSGAPVVLPGPDNRLVGTVVAAEQDGQRRLYVVPLAEALNRASGLAEELRRLTGEPVRLEARAAPSYKKVLDHQCLGVDGTPQRVGQIPELGVFGVKPADLPGETTYLEYTPRDDDTLLVESLGEATASRRVLLVVGGSASGKSRAIAEAARRELEQHRLLRPRRGDLANFATLPLGDNLPAVVWLDDLNSYTHPGIAETLRELLDAGLEIVATIRQAQFDELAKPGDLRSPIAEALTDKNLILQVPWKLTWSDAERSRLAEHVHYQPLLTAAQKGISPGVYVVAGPELIDHVQTARNNEEWPWRYRLVRAALDWSRTGIGTGLPLDLAPTLMAAVAETQDPVRADELDDAKDFATTAVLGGSGRKTRQSVLTLTEGPRPSFTVHDYLIDHDQQTHTAIISDTIWDTALVEAKDPDSGNALGIGAVDQGRIDVAAEAFTTFAEAGNTEAQYNLGILLATLLDPPDLDEARRCHTTAAEAGHTGAQNNLGVLLATLLDPPDLDEARRWFTTAAEAGNPAAQCNLGVLLANLLDSPDLDEAHRWFTTAAEAGNTEAQYNLGVLLATRLDPPDLVEARRWYTTAAEAGHTGAQFNLGVLLATELDPPDLVEARRWYTTAAEAGHAEAQCNLGVLLANLLDPTDLVEARRWFTTAAETGHTSAQYNLGVLLATRLDPPDLDEARRWWATAAEAGHTEAQFNLGILLATLLDPPDLDEARRWYTTAAEAGHTKAQYNLGILLATRLDPPDLVEARRWYTTAAEAGHTEAAEALSQLQPEPDK
jgi:TPR repeat protein